MIVSRPGAAVPAAVPVTWAALARGAGRAARGGGGPGCRGAPGHAAAPRAAGLPMAGTGAAGRRRGQPRLEAAALAFLQMTLFTLLGVVLAYLLAARAGPLWDGWLAAADRRLGFSWPALLGALDRHPWLVVALGLAYHGLSAQMVAAIVLLVHHHRLGRLRAMVAAAVLSGLVTILVSAAMPAMGNLFDPAGFRHLWPSVSWMERGLVAGLRDGTARTLDLTLLTGIVSFPSFHATLAAIFLWAVRDVGRAGPPLALLAVATVLATPAFGGHYGVDVLAGLLLAPPAILLALRLERPRAAAPRGEPAAANHAMAAR